VKKTETQFFKILQNLLKQRNSRITIKYYIILNKHSNILLTNFTCLNVIIIIEIQI